MKSLLKSLLTVVGLAAVLGIAGIEASYADTIAYSTSEGFAFSGAISGNNSNVIPFSPDSFTPTITFSGFIYDSFDLPILVPPSGKATLEATLAAPTAIPEPAAMILLGMGLAGVAAGARKRHQARNEQD